MLPQSTIGNSGVGDIPGTVHHCVVCNWLKDYNLFMLKGCLRDDCIMGLLKYQV